MRRTISLFLFILVLTCSISALADIPDFSQLTDEELLTAQSLMNEEIIIRGILKKIKIPAGHYKAGEDIPCGKYVLTTEDDVGLINAVQLVVFDDENGFASRSRKHALVIEQFYSPNSCTVELKKGNVLYLENGSFYIERFNLSFFE